MAGTYTPPGIDEYLRKRLMPVEGTIPHIEGIEMYGNSIPAGTVGGDLFEYINFQQRYDINARIHRALKQSKQYLQPLPPDTAPHNSVDDHVKWLKSRPNYKPQTECQYREARSSEQVRVAEDLLYFRSRQSAERLGSHSKIGLMRAGWSREEFIAANRGELSFSVSERERIQKGVVARYRASR